MIALWDGKSCKPLRANPVVLIGQGLRGRAVEYLAALAENKNGAGRLHFEDRLKLFLGAVFRKISNQYQAAHRRVFGVRPNQRLQAR